MVELLRKALEWRALLESGEVSNQAAIARQDGLTRARIAQVMGLLRLAPKIQEHILVPEMVGRPIVTERALRPISRLKSNQDQVTKFHNLIRQEGQSGNC